MCRSCNPMARVGSSVGVLFEDEPGSMPLPHEKHKHAAFCCVIVTSYSMCIIDGGVAFGRVNFRNPAPSPSQILTPVLWRWPSASQNGSQYCASSSSLATSSANDSPSFGVGTSWSGETAIVRVKSWSHRARILRRLMATCSGFGSVKAMSRVLIPRGIANRTDEST